MNGKNPDIDPTPIRKTYDPIQAVPQLTILSGQQDPIRNPTTGLIMAVASLTQPAIPLKEFCWIAHSNNIETVKKIQFPNKPPITFPDKQPKVKAEAIIIAIIKVTQTAYDQDPQTYSLMPDATKLLQKNPEIPPTNHL